MSKLTAHMVEDYCARSRPAFVHGRSGMAYHMPGESLVVEVDDRCLVLSGCARFNRVESRVAYGGVRRRRRTLNRVLLLLLLLPLLVCSSCRAVPGAGGCRCLS